MAIHVGSRLWFGWLFRGGVDRFGDDRAATGSLLPVLSLVCQRAMCTNLLEGKLR